MADMLDEAVLVYSQGSGDAELLVTTPAKEGSVIVEFLVFATNPAVLEVLKYLGFSSAGAALGIPSAIQIIKKLRNRKITKLTIDKAAGIGTIETDQGVIQCDSKVAALVGNKKIRDAMQKVVQAPLQNKNDAQFKVLGQNNEIINIVGETEINDFSPMPIGSLEQEHIEFLHINISFAQVNFDSKNGWRIRFADGKEKSATMQDAGFLRRVKDAEQAFKKDDLYEAKIKITTTERLTRSTIIYEVIEITRHWVDKDQRLV
ncbi:hypothetical protein QN400_10635 [Pseudomonas sp. RTC3]|uniref:hypothetical protein n=1 Tax=Pseudomonas sp. 5C2 TaxID=3048588 RepID=UPI002AB3DF9D|nr:hypothetical protein [Pseudomonas sp. 5C2]MDY7565814.1 hypothetical protein [Pseudomonas sp. 5C2]MEB0062483.1 hypothetical protein [Pseudomonas sp. RTC3]MEB0240488.1 hypothetical protein [Pseudomonas sp. 5C2]